MTKISIFAVSRKEPIVLAIVKCHHAEAGIDPPAVNQGTRPGDPHGSSLRSGRYPRPRRRGLDTKPHAQPGLSSSDRTNPRIPVPFERFNPPYFRDLSGDAATRARYDAAECLPPKNSPYSNPCLPAPVTPRATITLLSLIRLCLEMWYNSGRELARTGKRLCWSFLKSGTMAELAAPSCARTVPDAARHGTPTGRQKSRGLAGFPSLSLDRKLSGGPTARRARFIPPSRGRSTARREAGKKGRLDISYEKLPRERPIRSQRALTPRKTDKPSRAPPDSRALPRIAF